MALIPPAEFAPDMPALANSSARILNVVPRTQESYGPLRGLEPFTSALDAICIGAVSVEDADLSAFTFAGTATKLYNNTGGATTWTDVSQAGNYTTSDQEYWRFAQWKNLILATNFGDPVQSYEMGVSTDFADLSADAPQGRHVAVIRNFAVLANTNDATDGNVPQRIWWSEYNEPSSWPAPGSAAAAAAQSDFTDLVGDQGQITGLVGHLGGSDGAVFFARGVWRMIYQGPPVVFGFYPAEGVKGTRASNSIVHMGPVVYYLSEDGFAVFDGTSSKPIGVQRVDKWFFENANLTYLDHVIGSYDPVGDLVLWLFPSSASESGAPDKILIYNWKINRWSYADVSAEWLVRSITPGISPDSMDTPFPSGLDSVPYSLDSRFFLGGAMQLAGFDSDHKLGYFQGETLAGTIETQEAQPFAGQRAFVRSVRPMVDGGTPTVGIGTRGRLADSVTWGSDVAMNDMGESPQRADARYIRAVVKIPASTDWNHMRGVDVDAAPAGWR